MPLLHFEPHHVPSAFLRIPAEMVDEGRGSQKIRHRGTIRHQVIEMIFENPNGPIYQSECSSS